MRSISIAKLVFAALFFLTMALGVVAEPPSTKLVEMFPNDLGKFHKLPSLRPLVILSKEGMLTPETFRSSTDLGRSPFIGGETEYLSPADGKFTVEIIKFNQDPDAYSFLTLVAKRIQASESAVRLSLNGVGTASVESSSGIAFFKGGTFVRVTKAEATSKRSDGATALARLFADRIDKGENDVPVLLKHLPDWETAEATAVYAVSPKPLENQVNDQTILDSINFEGGTEAVTAYYGPSQMVIVEFTTPQLAGDNDRRIVEKIHELWSQGKPSPTAYRRVGNYSVFVFQGTSQQAANQLIDQVQYEQVVQWLGDNPHWLEAAQKRYVDTTLGVFVSVVKASGLLFIICFGIGGLFGGMLFMRRRAQQVTYSDAGGMMRLNLDELTTATEAERLIGSGMRDKS